MTPAVVNHYNVQPVFDVYASADRRDLGGVAREIDRVVERMKPQFPKGTQVTMRGQVESMRSSFTGLGLGIVFAILLVYLVLVINFQSWLDPLIIIMALPGALAGIVWMLFVTHTTFTVPSLMGAIMAMGVATANSVLLITFADDQRRGGRTAPEAAIDAGFARLRPVCMTALAMIIGMLPMALGLGEGGEQNAPLGRAVIGGLVMATFFTLVIVPLIYSVLADRRGPRGRGDRVIQSEFHHDPSHHDAHASAAPAVTPMSGVRLRNYAIGAAIALVLLLVLTMLPRHNVSRELLADAAARDSAPMVQVAMVSRAAPGSALTLPGTVQPLHESAIYARVGGYVRRWSADIGTLVRQGALLAEIDAPELEQNVQQARSQVQMNAGRAAARQDRSRALDQPRAGQRGDEPGARPEAGGVRVGRGEHGRGRGESSSARRDARLHAHRGAVHRRRSRRATSTSAR